MNKDRRLLLHETLCTILGSRNVYFQPPSSVLMKYPAIRYTIDGERDRHADDFKYQHFDKYSITYIDLDPESDVPGALSKLQFCTLDRTYTADGLNHYIFTLFY